MQIWYVVLSRPSGIQLTLTVGDSSCHGYNCHLLLHLSSRGPFLDALIAPWLHPECFQAGNFGLHHHYISMFDCVSYLESNHSSFADAVADLSLWATNLHCYSRLCYDHYRIYRVVSDKHTALSTRVWRSELYALLLRFDRLCRTCHCPFRHKTKPSW